MLTGVAHGARNVGTEPASYLPFFPTSAIDIEYLEHPVSGTEGDPPRPPFVYDAREP